MITPVIAMPERQKAKVAELVDVCRKLDGTVPVVIPISHAEDEEFRKQNPETNFDSLQAFGLRTVANKMKGKPFMWLEPDSVPLKAGWLQVLEDEYNRLGKPYLLSSDCHPPHDLAGGIGIYGPDTYWQIPSKFEKRGWDTWMLKHLGPELVAQTPLIQHSYGVYDQQGFATPRRFFTGSDRLSEVRDDAVIYHRDVYLDLAKKPKAPRLLHTGDLGDIIASLPIIRHIGGCDVVLTDSHDPAARPMHNRVGIIAPLLSAQPYVNKVTYEPNPDHATIDFNLRDFRRIYSPTRTLTETQALWLKQSYVSMRPWLTVPPSVPNYVPLGGLVVVSRTPRYQNANFPWMRLVYEYGHRMGFVGTREEHEAFCTHVRRNIPHLPTDNLLQVAEIINICDLFIGNQSAPCWIAMGLGKRIIQETHMTQLDSIVRRPGYQFVQTSVVALV